MIILKEDKGMKKWLPISAFTATALFFAFGYDDAQAKEGVTCDSTEVWTTEADVKDQLEACYKNSVTNIQVSYANTLTVDIQKIMKDFYYQQQYEYVAGTQSSWKGSTKSNGSNITTTLTMKYLITPEQEAYATKIVDQIADDVKNLPSDLAKVKYVNDWISKQTTYSKTGKNSTHAIYALFNDQKAVCQAYALATYRILTKAGVEVHYVTGTGNKEAHAWNVVNVDGQWYNLDVTWNDPKETGLTGYRYFLMDDATFFKSHTEDAQFEWYKNYASTSTTYTKWHSIARAATDDTNMVTYYNPSGSSDIYKFTGTDIDNAQKVGTGQGQMESAAVSGNYLYFVDSSKQLKKIDSTKPNEAPIAVETKKVTELTAVGDFVYYKVSGKKTSQYTGSVTTDYSNLQVVSVKADAIEIKLPKESYDAATRMIDLITPKGQVIALNEPTKKDGNILRYEYKTPLESVAKGKWTINGKIYSVLGDDANKKKALAVDKKIQSAAKVAKTNKNYMRNIVAANNAYNTLTLEQQAFVTEKANLDNLLKTIEDAYKPIKDFEALVNSVTDDNLLTPGVMKDKLETTTATVQSLSTEDPTDSPEVQTLSVDAQTPSTTPASKVLEQGAISQYNSFTKEQLSYVNATVKKLYTSLYNKFIVADAAQDATALTDATRIVDFNKAYKKLKKEEKAALATNENVTKLTDKTLLKNATAAVAMQKKIPALQVQKKNDKKKLLYYEVDADNKKTTKETTTKTIYPVMVENEDLSSILKAQKAYTDLGVKNPAAQALVNTENLTKLQSKIQPAIDAGNAFKEKVENIETAATFAAPMTEAKNLYINLSADELKYTVDSATTKKYKEYLKIDKVIVMYDKMDDPEASTKALKLDYTPVKAVTAITNDVKFSKTKFSIPKGNYTFTFKDNGQTVTAYYQNGAWKIGDLPNLPATPVTAEEVVAYAKAFNALKADQKALLMKGTTPYAQFIGKEDDYKKAAAVEKKITAAVKANKEKSFETAKKAYEALTGVQKSYVSNATSIPGVEAVPQDTTGTGTGTTDTPSDTTGTLVV